MKRSESTALAATAKNWTPPTSHATKQSSRPALGMRPEGSRVQPRAFALFGYGAAVLSRGTDQGQFSAVGGRSRFTRIYATTDTKNSAFGQCTSYDWEVQCYRLCPEIDPETNEMKSISATWRTCAP